MTSKIIYRADELPVLQNKMYVSMNEAKGSNVGNVVLAQNERTGIVENVTFDPNLIIYDQSYQNEQGVSDYFKMHLEQVRDIVIQQMGKIALIEVGCGKGYFLNMLREVGANIKGVDAAYEGVDPDIIKAMFCPGIGLKGNAIILRHVLEHIQDPVNFLWSLAEANDGGLIYIEVPCFNWIMQNNAWFDVFYEHVNYFRMEDFYRIFSTVKSSGYLFNNQYMYVIADLASLNSLNDFKKDDVVDFPRNFLSSLIKVTEYLKTKQGKVAVWGGASKGVIFTLYAKRAGIQVDYIVDINPAKQGKYIPISGMSISSPEVVRADVDVYDIVIMNSNYADEIKSLMGNDYNYLMVENNEI